MWGDQLRAIEMVKVSDKRTQDLEIAWGRVEGGKGERHESKRGVQADLSLLAYMLVGWGCHFARTWSRLWNTPKK